MEKDARLFYILNWHKMFFVEVLKIKKRNLWTRLKRGEDYVGEAD